MAPAIELDGVSRQYGGRMVVEDVSFAVGRDEIVGFLGPNGAGKTTTLRMIVGYLAPTRGRVTVNGHDMARDHVRAARSIGYAPERPPLYDVLDVTGYLRFVARAKGIPRPETGAEVERVVGACRLEAVAGHDTYKLSKGYRQRLGLAQALLGRPEVLLLDEPTSGLDPGQIQETREVIRSFGQGRAVLLSTHILPEVTLICDRVAILHHGRLLAIDSPAGLSRTVEETSRIDLVAAAPAGELRTELLGVEGVRAVAAEGGADGGPLAVTCTVDAEREGVEAGIARAVAARWDLYRLERVEPTLENVFLSYVRAEPSP